MTLPRLLPRLEVSRVDRRLRPSGAAASTGAPLGAAAQTAPRRPLLLIKLLLLACTPNEPRRFLPALRLTPRNCSSKSSKRPRSKSLFETLRLAAPPLAAAAAAAATCSSAALFGTKPDATCSTASRRSWSKFVCRRISIRVVE